MVIINSLIFLANSIWLCFSVLPFLFKILLYFSRFFKVSFILSFEFLPISNNSSLLSMTLVELSKINGGKFFLTIASNNFLIFVIPNFQNNFI